MNTDNTIQDKPKPTFVYKVEITDNKNNQVQFYLNEHSLRNLFLAEEFTAVHKEAKTDVDFIIKDYVLNKLNLKK